MGGPDATDDAVMQALRDAQCMDIIEKFPEGVDTMIAQRGIYVSGGSVRGFLLQRAFFEKMRLCYISTRRRLLPTPNSNRSVQQAFEEAFKKTRQL